MPQEHEKTPAKSPDYVEVRIPKFFSKTAPVNLVLLVVCVVFAFLLGAAGMRLFQLESGMVSGAAAVPTDAITAFTGYAKTLKLNTKDFQSCLESGKHAQKVQGDIAAATELQVNATPAFFINGYSLVGAMPFETFKALIEQELTGIPAPTPTPEPDVTAPPAPLTKSNVGVGNLPTIGKDSAKVTIVEFSDFQCPFCKSFFDGTFAQIKKEYIDTGKVKFAFRHYPLSFHQNAQKAGEASECAHEQGKFWEYHDLLFKMQDSWANLPTLPVSST